MTKQKVNSMVLAATNDLRFIKDTDVARCLKSITDVLQLAHKEIEGLKAQLSR